jgi:hypothetical protein
MRDAPPLAMRFKPLVLSLGVLVLPTACERNRTVKTIPVATVPAAPLPPAEARAVPPLNPEIQPEEDLDTNLPARLPEPQPAPLPSENTDDNTGVNGDQPVPNVEAGPDQSPTNPPK